MSLKYILGFVLVLIFIESVFLFKGNYFTKKLNLARNKQNWPETLRYAQKAKSIFYTMDETSIPLDWYAGSALFNLGRRNEAFTAFSNAYKYHPNHLQVLNNLGTCYDVRGDHEQALIFYKKAMNISGGFTDAHINAAIVYYNQKKFERAFKVLSQANDSITFRKNKNLFKAVFEKSTGKTQVTDEQLVRAFDKGLTN